MTKSPASAYLEERALFGVKLGLDAIRALLAELGHPEACAPCVLVAGTNGSAYLFVATPTTWDQARVDAGELMHLGQAGHLVTFADVFAPLHRCGTVPLFEMWFAVFGAAESERD